MASSWKDLTIRKTEKTQSDAFPTISVFLLSDIFGIRSPGGSSYLEDMVLSLWDFWILIFITKLSLSISILKETVSRKWSWFDWLTQKYYSSSGLHYEMGSKSLFVFPKTKYTCEISVDSSSHSGALSFSSWEPHAVSLPSGPCESFGIFEISKSLSKHILEFNQGTWSVFCRLQTMNSFPNF